MYVIRIPYWISCREVRYLSTHVRAHPSNAYERPRTQSFFLRPRTKEIKTSLCARKVYVGLLLLIIVLARQGFNREAWHSLAWETLKDTRFIRSPTKRLLNMRYMIYI